MFPLCVSAEENPVTEEAAVFTDDLGREVTVTSCERTACLIGSFADLWCLAGGSENLVAAANDTWTSFDLDLSEDVVNLGEIKEPNLELLIESDPDLVIASSNTQADVDLEDTLTDCGMTVAYFDVQNFSDYLRVLKIMTDITGKTENYEKYGTALEETVADAVSRQDDSHPTVLCIRATGSSVKVKGSEDNVLGEMLHDLGCENIADNEDSLLENLSLEVIIDLDPEYIFVVVQGSDPTDAEKMLNDTLLDNPAWSELTAVKEGRYYVLDNKLYNLKPNAKWGEAYENLADILYPEE